MAYPGDELPPYETMNPAGVPIVYQPAVHAVPSDYTPPTRTQMIVAQAVDNALYDAPRGWVDGFWRESMHGAKFLPFAEPILDALENRRISDISERANVGETSVEEERQLAMHVAQMYRPSTFAHSVGASMRATVPYTLEFMIGAKLMGAASKGMAAMQKGGSFALEAGVLKGGQQAALNQVDDFAKGVLKAADVLDGPSLKLYEAAMSVDKVKPLVTQGLKGKAAEGAWTSYVGNLNKAVGDSLAKSVATGKAAPGIELISQAAAGVPDSLMAKYSETLGREVVGRSIGEQTSKLMGYLTKDQMMSASVARNAWMANPKDMMLLGGVGRAELANAGRAALDSLTIRSIVSGPRIWTREEQMKMLALLDGQDPEELQTRLTKAWGELSINSFKELVGGNIFTLGLSIPIAHIPGGASVLKAIAGSAIATAGKTGGRAAAARTANYLLYGGGGESMLARVGNRTGFVTAPQETFKEFLNVAMLKMTPGLDAPDFPDLKQTAEMFTAFSLSLLPVGQGMYGARKANVYAPVVEMNKRVTEMAGKLEESNGLLVKEDVNAYVDTLNKAVDDVDAWVNREQNVMSRAWDLASGNKAGREIMLANALGKERYDVRGLVADIAKLPAAERNEVLKGEAVRAALQNAGSFNQTEHVYDETTKKVLTMARVQGQAQVISKEVKDALDTLGVGYDDNGSNGRVIKGWVSFNKEFVDKWANGSLSQNELDAVNVILEENDGLMDEIVRTRTEFDAEGIYGKPLPAGKGGVFDVGIGKNAAEKVEADRAIIVAGGLDSHTSGSADKIRSLVNQLRLGGEVVIAPSQTLVYLSAEEYNGNWNEDAQPISNWITKAEAEGRPAVARALNALEVPTVRKVVLTSSKGQTSDTGQVGISLFGMTAGGLYHERVHQIFNKVGLTYESTEVKNEVDALLSALDARLADTKINSYEHQSILEMQQELKTKPMEAIVGMMTVAAGYTDFVNTKFRQRNAYSAQDGAKRYYNAGVWFSQNFIDTLNQTQALAQLEHPDALAPLSTGLAPIAPGMSVKAAPAVIGALETVSSRAAMTLAQMKAASEVVRPKGKGATRVIHQGGKPSKAAEQVMEEGTKLDENFKEQIRTGNMPKKMSQELSKLAGPHGVVVPGDYAVTGALNGLQMQGKIDAYVIHEDGEVSLIDATGVHSDMSLTREISKDESRLTQKSMQLLMYKDMVEQSGVRVKSLYVAPVSYEGENDLAAGGLVKVSEDAALRARVNERIEDAKRTEPKDAVLPGGTESENKKYTPPASDNVTPDKEESTPRKKKRGVKFKQERPIGKPGDGKNQQLETPHLGTDQRDKVNYRQQDRVEIAMGRYSDLAQGIEDRAQLLAKLGEPTAEIYQGVDGTQIMSSVFRGEPGLAQKLQNARSYDGLVGVLKGHQKAWISVYTPLFIDSILMLGESAKNKSRFIQLVKGAATFYTDYHIGNVSKLTVTDFGDGAELFTENKMEEGSFVLTPAKGTSQLGRAVSKIRSRATHTVNNTMDNADLPAPIFKLYNAVDPHFDGGDTVIGVINDVWDSIQGVVNSPVDLFGKYNSYYVVFGTMQSIRSEIAKTTDQELVTKGVVELRLLSAKLLADSAQMSMHVMPEVAAFDVSSSHLQDTLKKKIEPSTIDFGSSNWARPLFDRQGNAIITPLDMVYERVILQDFNFPSSGDMNTELSRQGVLMALQAPLLGDMEIKRNKQGKLYLQGEGDGALYYMLHNLADEDSVLRASATPWVKVSAAMPESLLLNAMNRLSEASGFPINNWLYSLEAGMLLERLDDKGNPDYEKSKAYQVDKMMQWYYPDIAKVLKKDYIMLGSLGDKTHVYFIPKTVGLVDMQAFFINTAKEYVGGLQNAKVESEVARKEALIGELTALVSGTKEAREAIQIKEKRTADENARALAGLTEAKRDAEEQLALHAADAVQAIRGLPASFAAQQEELLGRVDQEGEAWLHSDEAAGYLDDLMQSNGMTAERGSPIEYFRDSVESLKNEIAYTELIMAGWDTHVSGGRSHETSEATLNMRKARVELEQNALDLYRQQAEATTAAEQKKIDAVKSIYEKLDGEGRTIMGLRYLIEGDLRSYVADSFVTEDTTTEDVVAEIEKNFAKRSSQTTPGGTSARAMNRPLRVLNLDASKIPPAIFDSLDGAAIVFPRFLAEKRSATGSETFSLETAKPHLRFRDPVTGASYQVKVNLFSPGMLNLRVNAAPTGSGSPMHSVFQTEGIMKAFENTLSDIEQFSNVDIVVIERKLEGDAQLLSDTIFNYDTLQFKQGFDARALTEADAFQMPGEAYLELQDLAKSTSPKQRSVPSQALSIMAMDNMEGLEAVATMITDNLREIDKLFTNDGTVLLKYLNENGALDFMSESDKEATMADGPTPLNYGLYNALRATVRKMLAPKGRRGLSIQTPSGHDNEVTQDMQPSSDGTYVVTGLVFTSMKTARSPIFADTKQELLELMELSREKYDGKPASPFYDMALFDDGGNFIGWREDEIHEIRGKFYIPSEIMLFQRIPSDSESFLTKVRKIGDMKNDRVAALSVAEARKRIIGADVDGDTANTLHLDVDSENNILHPSNSAYNKLMFSYVNKITPELMDFYTMNTDVIKGWYTDLADEMSSQDKPAFMSGAWHEQQIKYNMDGGGVIGVAAKFGRALPYLYAVQAMPDSVRENLAPGALDSKLWRSFRTAISSGTLNLAIDAPASAGKLGLTPHNTGMFFAMAYDMFLTRLTDASTVERYQGMSPVALAETFFNEIAAPILTKRLQSTEGQLVTQFITDFENPAFNPYGVLDEEGNYFIPKYATNRNGDFVPVTGDNAMVKSLFSVNDKVSYIYHMINEAQNFDMMKVISLLFDWRNAQAVRRFNDSVEMYSGRLSGSSELNTTVGADRWAAMHGVEVDVWEDSTYSAQVPKALLDAQTKTLAAVQQLTQHPTQLTSDPAVQNLLNKGNKKFQKRQLKERLGRVISVDTAYDMATDSDAFTHSALMPRGVFLMMKGDLDGALAALQKQYPDNRFVAKLAVIKAPGSRYMQGYPAADEYSIGIPVHLRREYNDSEMRGIREDFDSLNYHVQRELNYYNAVDYGNKIGGGSFAALIGNGFRAERAVAANALMRSRAAKASMDKGSTGSEHRIAAAYTIQDTETRQYPLNVYNPMLGSKAEAMAQDQKNIVVPQIPSMVHAIASLQTGNTIFFPAEAGRGTISRFAGSARLGVEPLFGERNVSGEQNVSLFTKTLNARNRPVLMTEEQLKRNLGASETALKAGRQVYVQLPSPATPGEALTAEEQRVLLLVNSLLGNYVRLRGPVTFDGKMTVMSQETYDKIQGLVTDPAVADFLTEGNTTAYLGKKDVSWFINHVEEQLKSNSGQAYLQNFINAAAAEGQIDPYIWDASRRGLFAERRAFRKMFWQWMDTIGETTSLEHPVETTLEQAMWGDNKAGALSKEQFESMMALKPGEDHRTQQLEVPADYAEISALPFDTQREAYEKIVQHIKDANAARTSIEMFAGRMRGDVGLNPRNKESFIPVGTNEHTIMQRFYQVWSVFFDHYYYGDDVRSIDDLFDVDFVVGHDFDENGILTSKAPVAASINTMWKLVQALDLPNIDKSKIAPKVLTEALKKEMDAEAKLLGVDKLPRQLHFGTGIQGSSIEAKAKWADLLSDVKNFPLPSKSKAKFRKMGLELDLEAARKAEFSSWADAQSSDAYQQVYLNAVALYNKLKGLQKGLPADNKGGLSDAALADILGQGANMTVADAHNKIVRMFMQSLGVVMNFKGDKFIEGRNMILRDANVDVIRQVMLQWENLRTISKAFRTTRSFDNGMLRSYHEAYQDSNPRLPRNPDILDQVKESVGRAYEQREVDGTMAYGMLGHDLLNNPFIIAIAADDDVEITGIGKEVFEQNLRSAATALGMDYNPADGLKVNMEKLKVKVAENVNTYKHVSNIAYEGISDVFVLKSMHGGYSAKAGLEHIFGSAKPGTYPTWFMPGLTRGRDWKKDLMNLMQIYKFTNLAGSVFFGFQAADSYLATRGYGGLALDIKDAFLKKGDHHATRLWQLQREIRRNELSEDHRRIIRQAIKNGYTFDITHDVTHVDLGVPAKMRDMMRAKARQLGRSRPDNATLAGSLLGASWIMDRQMQLSEALLGTLFPILKTTALIKTVEEFESQMGREFSDKEMRQVAMRLNNSFGGQNWNDYWWATPQNRQIMGMLWFAPNWTLSTFNIAGGNALLGKVGLAPMPSKATTDFQLKTYWPMMFTGVVAGLPNLFQAFITGMAALVGKKEDDDEYLTFLNEDGRRLHVNVTPLLRMFSAVPILNKLVSYTGGATGKQQVFVRGGKQIFEVFDPHRSWMADLISGNMNTAFGKMTAPARVVMELAQGTDVTGSWEYDFKGTGWLGWLRGENDGFWGSKTWHVVKSLAPFSMASLGDPQKRAFAFFASPAYGRSYSNIQKDVMKTLKTYGDEATWGEIKHNRVGRQFLASLVPDMMDAADRNGHNGLKILKEAAGSVRGLYMRQLYDAVERGDQSEINKAAARIMRINGSIISAANSWKAKQGKMTTKKTLTKDEIQAILIAFGGPDYVPQGVLSNE